MGNFFTPSSGLICGQCDRDSHYPSKCVVPYKTCPYCKHKGHTYNCGQHMRNNVNVQCTKCNHDCHTGGKCQVKVRKYTFRPENQLETKPVWEEVTNSYEYKTSGYDTHSYEHMPKVKYYGQTMEPGLVLVKKSIPDQIHRESSVGMEFKGYQTKTVEKIVRDTYMEECGCNGEGCYCRKHYTSGEYKCNFMERNNRWNNEMYGGYDYTMIVNGIEL